MYDVRANDRLNDVEPNLKRDFMPSFNEYFE